MGIIKIQKAVAHAVRALQLLILGLNYAQLLIVKSINSMTVQLFRHNLKISSSA